MRRKTDFGVTVALSNSVFVRSAAAYSHGFFFMASLTNMAGQLASGAV